MGDVIFLKGIQILVSLGVSASERTVRRPVTFDIELERDLERPGQSDRIEDTVDYGSVYEVVSHIASESGYRLVESLAERIATALLSDFDIDSVTVVVYKPKPVVGVLEHAGVRIYRRRPELCRRNTGQ